MPPRAKRKASLEDAKAEDEASKKVAVEAEGGAAAAHGTAELTACAGQAAADEIMRRAPGFKPRVALVLGSGMGPLADLLENKVIIPYGDLPGFHVGSVAGHASQIVLGTLNGVNILCFQGRVHLYEGVPAIAQRVPIYAAKLVGCEVLLATSAVGSLRPEVGAGELVLLTDHINMQGQNPMIGPNDPIGSRFFSMLDAYDPKLRGVLHASAAAAGVRTHEGVYLACLGPNFETPAEIRAFQRLGADVVGMSTVGEVLVARHCGLRVACIAVVVNLAAGLTTQHITHDETLHYGKAAAANVSAIIRGFLDRHAEW